MHIKPSKSGCREVALAALVQLAVIALKCCGIFTGPWIWVLAPTWIPLTVATFMIIVIVMFANK